MGRQSSTTRMLPVVPFALVVVGLGMVLIAALAGVVLWLITHRRPATVRGEPAMDDDGLHPVGDPAEA